MQGSFIVELIQFIEQKYKKQLEEILKKANVNPNRKFHETIVYDDKIFFNLLHSTSEVLQKSIEEVLIEYGEFRAPIFLQKAKAWKVISENPDVFDILKHTYTLHKNTMLYSSGDVRVPLVEGHPISENEIKIVYKSERRLSALIIGIVKGLEKLFNTPLHIEKIKDEENGKYVEFLVRKLQ